MKAISICSSMLQNPRCRIRCLLKENGVLLPKSLTSIFDGNFNGLGSIHRRHYSLKPLGANTDSHFRKKFLLRKWMHEKQLTQQGMSRNANPGDVKIKGDKPCTVSPDEPLDRVIKEGTKSNVLKSKVSKLEVLNEVVVADTKLNVNKSGDGEFEGIEYCDVQQKKTTGVKRLATIFVFDIETTGLSREGERIIEIALRDLNGGKNSTFETRVNPERYVSNAHIHGIKTHMVRRPDVPRFKDLIPILRKYVRARQIPGLPVLWVAHNARCFDVPFLINEFSRCSELIPSDWLFLDTLPLARELAKLEGSKGLSGKSLKALREFYGIPLEGKAHRAMADVHVLSEVLRNMTNDLKLPVSSLLERSFKAADLMK